MVEINDYEKDNGNGTIKVKVICLGDSAVGKSKLVERFLMDGYQPHQLSTYALNMYKYDTEIEGKKISIADMNVITKSFNFAKKNNMALDFVSASDGTNVVRAFTSAIRAAVAYKETSTDIMDQIMEELENIDLDVNQKKDDTAYDDSI